MYSKILSVIGVTVAISIVILSFNNLNVKELVQTKISGLLTNQSTLLTQKDDLILKVKALDGNVETLLEQKEVLINNLEEVTSENTELENQVEDLLLNINTLQEVFEFQQNETEKANNYIKEIYDYLNSIDIISIPELETMPTYEIEDLDIGISKDKEEIEASATWDTTLNPGWNVFEYEGLNFQLIVLNGEIELWFLDNRDNAGEDINVVLEYKGVDDKDYTLTLNDYTFNTFKVQPKVYSRIIINHDDGTKKVIAMI